MKLPLIALALLAAACTPPSASAYEAQQRACVQDAATREAADACRCEVKKRFGNPCDAGASDQ